MPYLCAWYIMLNYMAVNSLALTCQYLPSYLNILQINRILKLFTRIPNNSQIRFN